MKHILPAFVLLLGFFQTANAQMGILDAGFGSSTPAGTAIFSGTIAGSFEQGIAIQTDSKILVTSGDNSGIARLNSNGSIDNAFGGGWVGLGQFSFGDLIVQGDGKILAAGRPTALSFGDLYIWRFKSNGTLDSTFGKNGRVGDSSLGSGFEHIAMQSGKIIWSGALGLKRLFLTDGSIDAGFGTNGFVRTTQLPIFPAAIAIDNVTGNIFLGGYTKGGSRLALMRLLSSGIIDVTFGTNGVDSLSLKATGLDPRMKIAINSAGKIIMASDYDNGTGNGIVCVGFNSNGSPDNTFGTSSVAYPGWNITGGYAFSGGMAIDIGDRIFVAATIMDNGATANGNDVAIVRLNSNGLTDASYGNPKLDINHNSDRVQAICVDLNGMLVVNGSSAGKEMVARYTTGTTGIAGNGLRLLQLSLSPNPVNRSAQLGFRIYENTVVSAGIFSMEGKQIATIWKNVKFTAGSFKKEISTSDLMPGIYQIKVSAGDKTQSLVFERL